MISKYEKVRPKVDYFDWKNPNLKFYLYIYLDPFKETYSKYNIGGEIFEFAYQPFYLGRASTNQGFRHNQHISEHMKYEKSNKEVLSNNRTIINNIKAEKFKEIETKMFKLGNSSPDYPRDWKEYKKNWIIILKSFKTFQELDRAERIFIKTIGTIKKQTGPLVNALLG